MGNWSTLRSNSLRHGPAGRRTSRPVKQKNKIRIKKWKQVTCTDGVTNTVKYATSDGRELVLALKKEFDP